MMSMLKKFLLYFLCFLFSHYALAEIPINTDKRIKTYVYHPSDVYLVTISPGFQTSIEFAHGEQIQTISVGDSFSWLLNPMGNRLFIKPLENNVRTNMTIITNLRTYQFDILSSSEKEYMTDIAYVIRFYYPSNNTNRY
ncbi:MAG: TrbG/VirB9 family P-type conjugative transfer protein [Rickettsiales bacterium]|nr:TrbG/VirB9 family P-type conjugative transfer protein [Rickettsiales bacterium]